MSYRFQKDISGCGIAGIMDTSGKKFNGLDAMKAIALQHDRGNGMGGGFAAYGIYPKYKDEFAFHYLINGNDVKKTIDEYMKFHYDIKQSEEIPTRDADALYPFPTSGINPEEDKYKIDPPILWRYFCTPKQDKLKKAALTEEDYVVKSVMYINEKIDGAYIISCGKNMGVFKGVGYPEDLGHFFKLEEYEGYIWTAHNRFPTNTQAWWGGAHPFTILDWSIVHNGEISSYGINKRYLEIFGYKCLLFTDTEVVAYILDLLVRKHKLPIPIALKVLTSPFWEDIEQMEESERELATALRMVYGSVLMNGPFAIIFAYSRGMAGLNDRIKLRPMVAGVKGDKVYLASEESAIREICPNPERIWNPPAGQPVIVELKK